MRSSLLAAALLGVSCGESSAAVDRPDATVEPGPPPVQRPALSAEPDDEAAYVYDQAELRTYELRLVQADLDRIDADPVAEEYVPGTLVFEGKEYGPVGVRYKGSAGGFIGCVGGGSITDPSGPKTCARLSMKVSFNWSDPEKRFFGLKKLQFHAMRTDASLLKERLIYWLYRRMNVPAPRAVHARLVINGELKGVFALVEQIDGRFTRSRFGDGGEGNLYKEVWPMHDDEALYRDALSTNEDDSPSVARMVEFAAALEAAGPSALSALVDEYLDRASLSGYLAVDRTTRHFDGPFSFYCGTEKGQGNNPGLYGNHNYFWYEERDSGPLWLIAWDVDLDLFTFGGARAPWYTPVDEASCGCSDPGFGISQRPAMCDKLIQAFATLADEYRERVQDLLEGPLSEDAVNEQLDAWSSQLEPAIREQASASLSPSVDGFRAGIEGLRSMVENARREAEAEGAATGR